MLVEFDFDVLEVFFGDVDFVCEFFVVDFEDEGVFVRFECCLKLCIVDVGVFVINVCFFGCVDKDEVVFFVYEGFGVCFFGGFVVFDFGVFFFGFDDFGFWVFFVFVIFV